MAPCVEQLQTPALYGHGVYVVTLGEGVEMSQKALTALVFLLVAFLGIVILVGLARAELDTSGIAVALSSVITGLVGGAILRGKSGDKDGDAK